MNERLKELMLEAGYAAPEIAGRAKRLADLIIKDCIGIVGPTQHHEVWAQSYLGGVDGLELLEGKIKNIKERFGIEE
jgi:hypothetical protein